METSKSIIKDNSKTGIGLITKEDVSVLIQAGILPAGVPTSQVQVFASVCKERGLSPFSKEIYLLGYKGKDGVTKYSTIVGIDGFRKMAKKDPDFAGVDDAKFNVRNNCTFETASDIILNKTKLISATVTVYKMVNGEKVGYTHTALFSEFTTGKQKWAEMPFQMISKVAESFAYRKAFGISGVHVEEEIGALKNEHQEQKIDDLELEEIQAAINQCKNKDDFKKLLKSNPSWKGNAKILDLMEQRNNEILRESK